jgi:hypothetical protein
MKEAFKTIVGGRSANSSLSGSFPRGIEILLKKAAVDQDFEEVLLRSPDEAAQLISLELEASEKNILAHTPKNALQAMIRHTHVHRGQVQAFRTMSASLMLAALVAMSSVSCDSTGSDIKNDGGSAPFDVPQVQDGIRVSTARMQTIQAALEQYKEDHDGEYLSTTEWEDSNNPLKEYVNTVELYDAWNSRFHYEGAEQDGHLSNYRLESYGPDGVDSDDDIPCPIEPEKHSW